MRTIQISGGRVIDPSQDIDRVTDVFLGRGRVLAIGEGFEEPDIVIDATGMIVCPGLIDIHVHLREPGNEEDETIATGAKAMAIIMTMASRKRLSHSSITGTSRV